MLFRSINPDIKRYCDYAKIECIKLTQPIVSLKTYNSLSKFKLEVEMFFNTRIISPEDEYYFFGNDNSIEGFYLAKLFSSICQVYNPYLNLAPEYGTQYPYKETWSSIDGIKHLIGRRIFRKELGIDLVFKSWKNRIAYGIDKEFIDKYNIERYDLGLTFQSIKEKVIKNNQVKQINYNTLFDGGIFLDEGVIKKESLRKLSKLLLDSKDFVVKDHPFFNNHIGYFKGCNKYPTYIPIEFTFKNIKKNFVSIYSLALKSALILGSFLTTRSNSSLVRRKSSRYLRKNSLVTVSISKAFPISFSVGACSSSARIAQSRLCAV